jgi:hypothetical protein
MRGFSDHRGSGAPATLIRSVWGRCAYLSLGAAVGAVLLAGCGDSSSAPVTGASGASGASGPSSTQVTKASFIKQADAVCAEANTAIADLTGGAVTGEESAQTSQELEIVRSELQSIQALQAPSEDRSTLNDFISALKDEIDALSQKNAAAAAGGDTTAADSALVTARTNAEAAATDYGMKDCGTGKARHTQSGVTTTVPTTPTTTVPTTTAPPATTTVPTTVPTTTTPPAEPPPPSGGTGGGTGGSTGGGTGGGTGSGGTGGSP